MMQNQNCNQCQRGAYGRQVVQPRQQNAAYAPNPGMRGAVSPARMGEPLPPMGRSGSDCGCSGLTREQLLKRITLSKFACVETDLYLDTHPEDAEAMAYFRENNRIYCEAMEEYAKAYGPLTLAHADCSCDYWDWVNQPWPWQ